MPQHEDIVSSDEILSEACAWVAQIDTGELSSSDIAALREWMGRSPRHAKEVKEIAALSGQLYVLTDMIDPISNVKATDKALRRLRWQGQFPIKFAAALAIPVVAFALFTFSPLWMSEPPATKPFEIAPLQYQTMVGEVRNITLEDGSTLMLNTDSEIKVYYEDSERRVYLLKGEALFDVAKNPARPFIVFAGEAVAEAVGTSFSIRLKGLTTELSVVEGIVAFSNLEGIMAASPSPSETLTVPSKVPHVLVEAGQVLVSDDIKIATQNFSDITIPNVEITEIKRKLSWTEGLFEFSQTPLEEVVVEVNRYNTTKIEIADDRLRELKMGGLFRTGDVDSLLEALRGMGIEIIYQGDGSILLQSEL